MPEHVTVEPNYENTLKYLGQILCDGQHEKPFLAMYSILDMMRYLTQKDLGAALRVVEFFKRQGDVASLPVLPPMYTEDDHLESDYEDRHLSDME